MTIKDKTTTLILILPLQSLVIFKVINEWDEIAEVVVKVGTSKQSMVCVREERRQQEKEEKKPKTAKSLRTLCPLVSKGNSLRKDSERREDAG